MRNTKTRPRRPSAAVPNPTTTTLASDLNSGAMGTVFTLTATVTVGGKPVTAGSVQFTDGSRVLGSVQVIISGTSVGTAVLKTDSFGVGPHSVTASYSGAPNSAQSTAPSKSTPVAITITGLAATSASLLVLPSTTQQGTYDITATLLAASSTIGHGTLTVDEANPYSSMNLRKLGRRHYRRLSVAPNIDCLQTYRRRCRWRFERRRNTGSRAGKWQLSATVAGSVWRPQPSWPVSARGHLSYFYVNA